MMIAEDILRPLTLNWSPTNETTSSIYVKPTTTTTYTAAATTGTTTCQDIVTVTVNPQEDATFTYSASSYCSDNSDPSPMISGTSGGTFTANSAGLNIVAATGLIDLDASTPGTYTITYTTPGANCSATSTQNVTIKDPPIISAGADQTVCAGSDVTLTGSGAVTYIWDNGVIDGEPFTPPSTANYVLTATEPFGTIATIGNQFETSNGTSGNFQGQSFTTGSSNALLLSITTNAIGGSSGAQLANGIAGSILNIRTYVNDVETGTNHALTGTILATASNPSILNTNYQAPSSKFIFDSTLTLIANTRYVIEFVSGSGVGIYSRLHSVSSGNDEYTGGQAYDIDGLNQSFVRDYPFLITTLENTNISGPNGCSATDMVTVTVNPQEDATFAYSASSYCADDSDPNPVNPTPTISGTSGGVFSSTAGLSINSSTGQVDLDASTPGTYNVTYITPNVCADTATQSVTIIVTPTVDLGNDVSLCAGDSTLLDAGSGHTNYLWNTGETTQTIYADTAGTYTVTVGNGTLVNNNYSMFFDDNNSGVDFGNSSNFDLEDTTTICFWAKDSSNRDIRRSFLYKGNCSSSYCTDLHIYSTSITNPSINWTSGSSSNPCNAGNINLQVDSAWHFYSFVFIPVGSNSGVKKIYFDGALIDSCSYDDNASPNSYNLIAGDYNALYEKMQRRVYDKLSSYNATMTGWDDILLKLTEKNF